VTWELPEGGAPRGPRRDALDRAARLLHLVAGVSYFKAAVPRRIEVAGPPPGPAAARLAAALYSKGLGELAWENRLPEVGRPPAIPEAPAPPAPPAGLSPRSLVPVGGGKDSAVTLAALVAAGEEVVAFSVGTKPSGEATAAAEGARMVHAERRLDPLLFELNRRGAINGHVPITAIVTCQAAIAALLHDCDAVAMSNERSASAGNVDWPEFGGEVNHQYSKGWEAEAALARAVREEVAADLAVFSALRPWSELAIARAFAGLERHHDGFMSCNAGFTIDRPGAQGWCGDCPKCRFVALALAPFVPRARLVAAMGLDVLDDPAQEAGVREIVGLGAAKPFECVGETEEARAALRAAAARPEWASAAVVRALAPELGGPDPEAVEPWLAPEGPDASPDRHRRAVAALLRPRR
jgi:hypothetical protein